MRGAELQREWEERLPGIKRLWQLTRGRPDIRVAVLDGPPHESSMAGSGLAPSGVADHGTHVLSILAGARDGSTTGLAPDCTVFSIPIFEADGVGTICTQAHLAECIHAALAQRANVINISASQQADLLALSSELNEALQEARRRDVLVVAAAGNQGCACETIPASVPGVLAVGAHGPGGAPLLSSNWGPGHRSQGIIAPGIAVPGACIEGGLCRASGTSFAAATVSAIAALLMSVDSARDIAPSGVRIRKILLDTSIPAPVDKVEIASTYLTGRLDVAGALDRLLLQSTETSKGEAILIASMSEHQAAPEFPTVAAAFADSPPPGGSVSPGDGLSPADCGCGGHDKPKGDCGCGCGGAAKKPQLIYAIGRLGISFISAARRDSIWRMVNGAAEGDLKPISDQALADLFKKSPFQAQSVVWTLSRSEVPMYAIVPTGAFAAETYKWLVDEWLDRTVEFASVPGMMGGQATLYDGSVVDVLVPDLRGMHSWETKRYVKALTDGRKKVAGVTDEAVRREMDRFLGKIYFAIRNRGVSPEERAINAAATNAFNFSPVIVEAGQEGLTLRDISVERSPLNRPGSEYYDVLLTFFNPKDRQGTAPLRARFTIDVSDTVPVMIGDPVIWYEY